ncbi:MAG: hypothetical protein A2Y73_08900 [Chloroflexi bacterium RBG_13_56_8]|nr:MAG: hypothetical protein A2Y73_08900 [Chloroflexi bacterium RBG_13_56_8]
MLKHFTEELERQRDKVNYHKVWRYTKAGRTPRLLLWLLNNPRLAQALAKDAQALAKGQQKEAA